MKKYLLKKSLPTKHLKTQWCFMQHVEERHNGWPEYRKRLFYLAEHWDGVRPIRPQEWRACVEAFAEDLVTGSSDWPACPAAAGSAEAPAADAPSEWWQPAGAQVPGWQAKLLVGKATGRDAATRNLGPGLATTTDEMTPAAHKVTSSSR